MSRTFLTILLSTGCYCGLNAQQMEKLGHNINTTFSECSPNITKDGKTLFFTRFNKPIMDGFYTPIKFDKTLLDRGTFFIWSSNLEGDKWSPPKKLDDPINRTILFPGIGNIHVSTSVSDICKNDKTLLLIDAQHTFSFVHKKRGKWSKLDPLIIDGIEDFISKETPAALSATITNNGRQLLFSVTKKDLSNEISSLIYHSRLNDDGNWSIPQPLSNTINNETGATSPWISRDGTRLYFVSLNKKKIHTIFYSERQDSSWTNWSKPKELSETFNDGKENSSFIIDPQEEYIYITKRVKMEIDDHDIYRIKITEDIKKELFLIEDDTMTVNIVDSSYTVLNSKKGEENGTNNEEGKKLVEMIKSKCSIYPNPVNQDFMIELSFSYDTNINITLLNANGKIIQQTNASMKEEGFSKRFFMGNLSKGIYLLTISDGQTSITKKLIKM